MQRRYQQRTRTCGSLVLTVLLLIIVMAQWGYSRRLNRPQPLPTPTATATFISRAAILAVVPTATPALRLPVLPTHTPTPTVTPTPTFTPTPLPTATPTATPEPRRQAQVTTSLLYVREGPGSDYPELVILGAGEAVTVFGRTADEGWLQVQTLSGVQGWVFAAYVSPIADAEVLAVRTPPPLP